MTTNDKNDAFEEQINTALEEDMASKNRDVGGYGDELRREVVQIVKTPPMSYSDQFQKMQAIQASLKKQLRTKIMELGNQFQQSRLAMLLAHEQELKTLVDGHQAQVAELERMLDSL